MNIRPPLRYFIIGIILLIISAFYYYFTCCVRQETRFIIASEGSTATTWLYSVLDAIPEIRCTHFNHVNEIEYQQVTNVIDDSLPQYFHKLSKYAHGKKIIGNVHGFTLNLLLSKKPIPKLKIVNLIRHPILHISSMQRYWINAPGMREIVQRHINEINAYPDKIFPSNYHHYTNLADGMPVNEAVEYANKIKTYTGEVLADDIETWTFLFILGRFQRVHANMQLATKLNIPQYKFEEITKDKDIFAELVAYISDGKVILSGQDRQNFVSTDPINVNHINKLSAAEQYNQWNKWQRLAFYLHLQQIGGLNNNAYVQAGYDLSFIDPAEFAAILARPS